VIPRSTLWIKPKTVPSDATENSPRIDGFSACSSPVHCTSIAILFPATVNFTFPMGVSFNHSPCGNPEPGEPAGMKWAGRVADARVALAGAT
jgi:hypothetical protein